MTGDGTIFMLCPSVQSRDISLNETVWHSVCHLLGLHIWTAPLGKSSVSGKQWKTMSPFNPWQTMQIKGENLLLWGNHFHEITYSHVVSYLSCAPHKGQTDSNTLFIIDSQRSGWRVFGKSRNSATSAMICEHLFQSILPFLTHPCTDHSSNYLISRWCRLIKAGL